MAKTIFANTNTKVIAVLAVMLAASLALTTASNADAYKTEIVDGVKTLNGHAIDSDHSTHAYVFTEVFMCSWYLDDSNPRCDFSWIPEELIDWLKSTNNYAKGNLRILN